MPPPDSLNSFLRMVGSLLARVTRFAFARALVFLGLVALAYRVPDWANELVWISALFAGVWTLAGLLRDGRSILDFLMPRLERGYAAGLAALQQGGRLWTILRALCAAALIGFILWRAVPLWNYMGTVSLREDEISSVASYTSRGFVPAITTYKLAKNHILFNVVNSLLPGASSTNPLRARAVSFLSLLGAFGLLVGYAWCRGWPLAGLACAGVMITNADAMIIVLEARGYGMLCFFAMLGSVALAEWLRTNRLVWLVFLGLACVGGTYTLPFYIIFGGVLLFLAFLNRPSKESFLAGAGTLAALAMLYLPIASSVFGVFNSYTDQYGGTFVSGFKSMQGVYEALQYFIPDGWILITPFAFILLALLAAGYLAMGDRLRPNDRTTFAFLGIALLGFLAFCLFRGTVPARVTAFLTAPMAFMFLIALGSLADAQPFAHFRPLPEVAIAFLGLVAVWKSEGSLPSLAKQNWKEIAIFIEHAFPPRMRTWSGGKHGKQLQWSLASRRKPEEGKLDQEALNSGKLVAVESAYSTPDMVNMIHWTDLGENVRFVTYPLIVNFQRVYFVPPEKENIASIKINGRPLDLHVPGRQPTDPFLLAKSEGRKDTLYDEFATDPQKYSQLPIAKPEEIKLPADLVIKLENIAPPGACNLLFTQGLEEKVVSAEVQNTKGEWHPAAEIFVLGELVSIVLTKEGSQAIRLHLARHPEGKVDTITGRPPLGLLDAWFVPH